MSLLMEALKKAEMAKRLAANAAAGEGSLPDLNAPDALSMEPMPVRTVAKAPELASTPEQFTEKPVEPVARTYTREEKPRLDELPGFHNISLDEPVMAPRPLAAAAPAAKEAKKEAAPAAPSGPAVFPSAVDPKYAKETAGKARMRTCVDQYNANKATNGNGGMKWIEKGGGYYSECNKKLKPAA